MNLALGAIGVAYDLYPALDALPVEQPRCLLHLIGEKVERLGRDRPACRLKGKRPGDFGTTTQRILWAFQGITCHIALLSW